MNRRCTLGRITRQKRIAFFPNCPTCGNILSDVNSVKFMAVCRCLDCVAANRTTVLPGFLAALNEANRRQGFRRERLSKRRARKAAQKAAKASQEVSHAS